MINMINLTINNIPVSVEEGTTIIEAARRLSIRIPSLCNHDDLCVSGNCRVCVVEQVGNPTLQAACATPVRENMQILTNSMMVMQARKTIIELLLSEHNADCTKCYKNGNCELQDLSNEYRIGNQVYIDLIPLKHYTIDQSSP
ncbi:MAG TPA: 2Fe-2S iron-sulfur cluster-binding protein, partial [Bacteroidales bacterium]|nr:2Fe-2S iron-sulfur cluster-binding protein [Bacteroidales bacterium]